MREIKFRVWDVTDERIYYGVTNIGDINGYIMQYTGLKDNNDKVIYEGDVLDASYTNPMTGGTVPKRFLVVHNNGGYEARARNHPYGSTLVSFIRKESKVIGNVFENPELKEGTNWHRTL